MQRKPAIAHWSGVTDIDAIAALLQEVAETHHRVYRITDGEDRDWASWYADWLLRLSELPELLGAPPVRSELVYELVRLDKEYGAAAPTVPWPRYYAERLAADLAIG
jgi:hypothetical protein